MFKYFYIFYQLFIRPSYQDITVRNVRCVIYFVWPETLYLTVNLLDISDVESQNADAFSIRGIKTKVNLILVWNWFIHFRSIESDSYPMDEPVSITTSKCVHIQQVVEPDKLSPLAMESRFHPLRTFSIASIVNMYFE